MGDKIMLFIPMYNCETQIKRVLDQIDSWTQEFFVEIIVVDNCSTDKGVEAAIKSMACFKKTKATLLQNDNNYNLGGSIKVAFNYAIKNNYSHILTLHGDDQGDIRDMLPTIQSGEYKDYDIVIGARFHKDSILIGYSMLRTIGNKLFNILYAIVTGKIIDDMIAGLNIFSVSFLSDQFYLRFPDNLTFDAHLLLYAISNNKKLKYIPVTWKEEDQVSNAKVLKQGFIILKLLFKYTLYGDRIFNMTGYTYNNNDYTSKLVYQTN